MPIYRKKPVEIEAVQWMGDNIIDIESLASISENDGCNIIIQNNDLKIKTLEGVMSAQHGDFIIKGVSGELYPCKPDIFEKTYDRVNVITETKTNV